jgi:hypothetical protein
MTLKHRAVIFFFLLSFLIALSMGSVHALGSEKILVSLANANGNDSVLWVMNPDGSGSKQLFNFHRHPRHNQGLILQPRIAPGGGFIYFSSDNAYAYTPASRNLFRITADGSRWEQLTPGPNSGKWGAPCPCGTVKGTVKRSNGRPYGSSAVFLEGVGMAYTEPDGSFGFDKVPEGRRWLLAYRPGAQAFDSREIYVARGAPVTAHMVPDSTFRWSFTLPVIHGDRVYYQSGINEIAYRGLDGKSPVTVYKAGGSCTGVTDVDGFDVGRLSGRLAVMDYQTGCTTNRGLYVGDKNGRNGGLLVDMKKDHNFSDGGEVFWSPDESKIAVEVSYNFHICFFVFDSRTGASLGYICAPNTNLNKFNTTLYGWSPDGGWLLYSQYVNNPAQSYLFKVRVTPQGMIDSKQVKTLLANVYITGATWGRLQ